MKNFSKMRFTRLFGIIAIIAVIGLFFSCEDEEATPEDQTKITFTNLPAGALDKYAVIALVNELDFGADTFKIIASTKFASRIRGASVTGEMSDYITGLAWGKADSLYVVIGIYPTSGDAAASEGDDEIPVLFRAVTKSKVAITKGEVTISITGDNIQGFPDIADVIWGAPSSQEFGTYLGSAAAATDKEKIELSTRELKITEIVAATGVGTGDYLTFEIATWEDATTPTASAATYPNAFKFTGKVTAASSGYIGSGKTAPTLTQNDITNGTTFTMYIYFTGTGDTMKFVRTAFTKVANEVPAIVTSDASNQRVYTKQ